MITIIAIQQAATQYSPRILRRFTSDRGNQIVLGAYVATFLYALLCLREVRTGGDGTQPFVPAVSISVALLLSIVGVALLVYFIHHITQQIQVATMLAGIRNDLVHEFRHLYPEQSPAGTKDPDAYEKRTASALPERPGQIIRASRTGYIATLDLKSLVKQCGGSEFVWVQGAVGAYVVKGSELVTVWAAAPLTDKAIRSLQNCYTIDDHRGTEQDALFGFQQIVDIAVKALSPGINDPSTAKQCISELKGLIAHLADREIPAPLWREDGTVILINRPGFADYVERSFGPIRRNARNSYEALDYLASSLGELLTFDLPAPRRAVLREELSQVARTLERTELPPDDQAKLLKKVRALLKDPREAWLRAVEYVA